MLNAGNQNVILGLFLVWKSETFKPLTLFLKELQPISQTWFHTTHQKNVTHTWRLFLKEDGSSTADTV